MIVQDTEATLAQLGALKALGVKLAIDGIARGGQDAALARTVIALGDTLALTTVPEGTEDAAQWERLRAMRCDLGQWYLFARPLSDAALRALVAAPRGAAGTV